MAGGKKILFKRGGDCRNEWPWNNCSNKVWLEWVPGHVGIKGNVTADVLARNGVNTSFIGPEPVLGDHQGCSSWGSHRLDFVDL
uniref:RNase H domain-containing protein n=1 Tax=Rhodnius prolixus TaxID=13249 RepID=T1I638_RHOPR